MNRPYEPVPSPLKNGDYQAYLILLVGYTLLPIIAGVDKFLYLLTYWEKYLAPSFNAFGSPGITMSVVGVIEIAAGIGVILYPRIFSYIVALWLVGIIVNLLAIGGYADIALRDFGLILGALALGRLSKKYGRR